MLQTHNNVLPSRNNLFESLVLTLADNLAQTSEQVEEIERPIWTPLPGPQTEAYYSLADELFYGGAAGGGKTDLMLGLAGTQHRSSVIFRREFPRLRGMIERSRQIFNARGTTHAKDSYNESLHIWRLADQRTIEFAAIQHDKDKEQQRGRPRDLYAWDEITEYSELMFRFVNAWNRTTIKGQRTRIVAGGNPPTTLEGIWVIKYWAPWLDPQHTNPAKPGELRWFAMVDGEEIELLTGDAFEHKGSTIYPRSRTFIPARLSDNPYLDSDPSYRATLQGLPEPLRSQMLDGNFFASMEDNPFQVIPTAWVVAAQKRWIESPEQWRKDGRPLLDDGRAMPLSAVGVDVARGGKDKTVLSKRYGEWYAALDKYPGTSTPDGPGVASLAVTALREGGHANIDGIGVGTSVYDSARQSEPDRVYSIIFSEAARDGNDKPMTDKTGRLEFANVRAACYWGFREALEPGSGHDIALPPDADLQADLCTPRYEVKGGRVYVESKEDIAKRLGGRSTDSGDAVILAWWEKPVRTKRVVKVLA